MKPSTAEAVARTAADFGATWIMWDASVLHVRIPKWTEWRGDKLQAYLRNAGVPYPMVIVVEPNEGSL